MKDLSVLKAKRFGIYSCYPGDTLRTAARTMNARNISALVVVDPAGYLLGVITRTDLVRACYTTDEWADALVQDYMTLEPVTVELDAPLRAVMELLLDRHIHRVVAVQRDGEGLRPVAVLSAADIVYHMAHDE
jgi:CBS domain-containing protein